MLNVLCILSAGQPWARPEAQPESLLIRQITAQALLVHRDGSKVYAKKRGQHPAPNYVLDGSRLLARLSSQLLKLPGVLDNPVVALDMHLLELKLQLLLLGPTCDQLILGGGKLLLSNSLELL